MNIDELRRLWREMFQSQPPPAFSKDLSRERSRQRFPELPPSVVWKPVCREKQFGLRHAIWLPGDWKMEVRDRPAKCRRVTALPAVSNLRPREGPRNAGLSGRCGNVSRFCECLADDAVLGEPVWSRKFPAIREKNREVFDFWPNWWATASITFCISGVCEKIPYAREQGNNSPDQRGVFTETEKISLKARSRRARGFGRLRGRTLRLARQPA